MDKTLEYIGLQGILPIATIDDEAKAEPFARIMGENGLSVIEVTLRTKAAASIINQIAKNFPEMIVGAGTVLSVNDARTAAEAGARFIVTPGFDPETVEYCLSKSIPVIPGVLTPTEMQKAVAHGLEVVKIFPAEAAGGLKYLKAVAAPFRSLKFVPTGGIDQSNMLSYLNFPRVLACAGSWIVPPEMLKTNDFGKISSVTRKAIEAILGFKLKSISLNANSAADARKALGQLEKIIQFPIIGTEDSLFSKTNTDELHQSYSGEYIVLSTNFIDRAVAFFERKRILAKTDKSHIAGGIPAVVDMNLEIDRFKLRLVQA
ncbi:MAG: bifunctional 4-hydroxy-2-oxoglutarate aldolase/2-dehydro-3-deoxy-phosphogluconate aldolase [Bacteroidetes bacterium]|nr:bifunctional 4-hydroxy-2-oxoglutarate aldolase/2-dehydro-3-deoxy-phosphogluconate aldolase [Bacteroidota bacterium]